MDDEVPPRKYQCDLCELEFNPIYFYGKALLCSDCLYETDAWRWSVYHQADLRHKEEKAKQRVKRYVDPT